MKLILVLLVGGIGLFLTASPGVLAADDLSAKEMERFQGKWKAIKIEGRNPGKLEGLRVTVKSAKFTLEGVAEKPLESTYKLDPSAKPKEIDVTFELGTLQGIYEFDGETLKVCYSELQESEKGKRPTEFAAPVDSKRYLWILKREK